MGRFGPRERATFLALKGDCYRGLGSAELLACVGERLGATVGADATCMVQLDPATALPVYMVSQGWPADANRPLEEHALLASPTADPGRLIAQGRRTVSVDDLVPAERSRHQDPYFVHHIFLGGYRHELQTACALGRRAQALLTLTRRAASGSFEARHVRLLDAVAPHVAAGLHAATVRESLAAPAGTGTGVIVLTAAGEVEVANALGERWLSREDAAGRPGQMWALRVLAGLLTRSLGPEGAAVVPSLEVADPATGALYRLSAERAVDVQGSDRTVILIEPVRGAERSETLLRLGLTPREAEVTLGILRGTSMEVLARESHVSPYTIAQHLRAVCAKLEVSSRRELMARLAHSA